MWCRQYGAGTALLSPCAGVSHPQSTGLPHCSSTDISEVEAAARSSLLDLCLSPGICMGDPAGCPDASHSSRVLHGAPAAPQAAGGSFPSPRSPSRWLCWAAGPTPAEMLGSASSPTTPLLLLWGLAAAEQGGQCPSLLFLKSRGAQTHCYTMAPEAMAMGTSEQAGREGPQCELHPCGSSLVLAWCVQLWEVHQARHRLVPEVILVTIAAAVIQCNCDTNC